MSSPIVTMYPLVDTLGVFALNFARSSSPTFFSTLPPSSQLLQRCHMCCIQNSSAVLSKAVSLHRQLNGNEVLSLRFISKRLQRSRMHYSCKAMCSSNHKDALPPPLISMASKIRSEVISPFRSVRMFFYLAFVASASIGGLIAVTQLIAALRNGSRSEQVLEIAQGLGLDLAAILLFALLYKSDAKARDMQLAKLSREESLASLRIELGNKRITTVGQMRGKARLVIISGPGSYIEEALKLSKPYQADLMERGVFIIPYPTDGSGVDGEASGQALIIAESENRWKAVPIYTSEWSRWLSDQKRLANVPEDKPVYISLRLDGRVRGSGVGLPPWGAFVAQLPPMKGIWGGAFDGMDGRV